MFGLMTAAGLALASVLLVVLGLLIARRGPEETHEEVTGEFLLKLGSGLGLDTYSDRTLFGEHLQTLRGKFEEFPVEFEVSRGDWAPYVRITVDFPRRLAQDLHVINDRRGGMVSQLRRLREIKLDDEEFDSRFLLFAKDEERAASVLNETARYQLVRMAEEVDEVRISDNTLFVLMHHACTREEMKSLLKKSLEVAGRLYQTARLLGPRSPSAEASHYEKATIETAARASVDDDDYDDQRRGPAE